MITPEKLRAYYRQPDKNPVLLGEMIREARMDYPTYQSLSRACRITAGTLHHYASLLNLPPVLQEAISAKTLKFKAARALADIPDPEKHAAVFISKRLSTVYVEEYVRLAKRHRGWPAEMVIQAMANPRVAPTTGDTSASDAGATQGAKRPSYATHATPAEIRLEALALVGRLRMLNGASEVERMPMVSALRTLKRELETVL